MPQPVDLRPLTALRFFAASWVVVYHFWPNLSAGPMPALAARGYLGVELFFTLSGFILCHVYLDGVAAGRFRYADFLWARVARIYPLHLATLAAVGIMALAAQGLGRPVDAHVLSWASLPANLTLTQAWGLAPEAGWNHPSWSISAEWFAYLSFPLFAWASLRLRRRPWLGLGLALVLLWGLYAAFEPLAGFSLTEATIRWGALRIIPCFALGCAVNQLWRSGVFRGRIAVYGAAFSGAGVVACVLTHGHDWTCSGLRNYVNSQGLSPWMGISADQVHQLFARLDCGFYYSALDFGLNIGGPSSSSSPASSVMDSNAALEVAMAAGWFQFFGWIALTLANFWLAQRMKVDLLAGIPLPPFMLAKE